jgi:hypothetical protein
MSKQLVIYIEVLNDIQDRVFQRYVAVDADLMHPADDPAITLQGVKTAIDYVLQEEAKR